MFKTCSDPDFNWVHCLCDSATWVVKEPGKPIGFFYSRLFDDALSPSGLGFAVDAFRIDEDGTLDDFYSDILWDYGAADELIAAYPNKFSCAVRCDGLNPYDIPTSWSHGEAERFRARETVLAAVDMLIDDADETGIDACPEFYRNDYISMYLKTQGLGERVKVGGAEALRFSVVSTDCSCGDDEKGDFETLGEAMRAAKRLVDVEGYEGTAVYDRKQEAWCAGCNVANDNHRKESSVWTTMNRGSRRAIPISTRKSARAPTPCGPSRRRASLSNSSRRASSVRILVFLENHIVQRGDRQAHRGRMGRGWRYLPCRLCRGHGAPRRRRLRSGPGRTRRRYSIRLGGTPPPGRLREDEGGRGDPRRDSGAAPERIRVDRGNTLTL